MIENTANVELFASIVPFRRSAAGARGKIDEKGSLPYKPRQLSAMTRFEPGRFVLGRKMARVWACQHPRTYLTYRAECRPTQARCQRRTSRETHLPTQQTGAQAPSCLPRAQCHDRRPQASERLSPSHHGSAKAAGGLPRRCQWRASRRSRVCGAKPPARRRWPDPGRVYRHQEERHRDRAQPHPAAASRIGETAGCRIAPSP